MASEHPTVEIDVIRSIGASIAGLGAELEQRGAKADVVRVGRSLDALVRMLLDYEIEIGTADIEIIEESIDETPEG